MGPLPSQGRRNSLTFPCVGAGGGPRASAGGKPESAEESASQGGPGPSSDRPQAGFGGPGRDSTDAHRF